MKITSSSRIFKTIHVGGSYLLLFKKTIHLGGGYLLLFKKRKLPSFDFHVNNPFYFEISVPFFKSYPIISAAP